MTDEESPTVKIMEGHEAFIRHLEAGASKIKGLALTTVVVATLLATGFAIQLGLPFATGQAVVQVSLTDPYLVSFEVLLLALASVWLYVGIRDYAFMRRLGSQIREARRQEQELFRKAGIG